MSPMSVLMSVICMHSKLDLGNKLCIPLHGKHTIIIEEEPSDLEEKIKHFLVFDIMNPSDPRVMLLIGDIGSGKSIIKIADYRLVVRSRFLLFRLQR